MNLRDHRKPGIDADAHLGPHAMLGSARLFLLAAGRGLSERHAAVAKAIDYMLTRWDAFTRFLEDGRICLSNNAAERALRGFALGRKSWLFAGSERGADRAALMYTLIQTEARRRRPADLARRRSRPYRRHAADENRRAAALELGHRTHPSARRLTAAYAGGLPSTWRRWRSTDDAPLPVSRPPIDNLAFRRLNGREGDGPATWPPGGSR